MAITYTVGEYTASDSSIQVVYTDDNGFEHRRHVNIPKNPDGTIDEEYFAEILEGQLRGVENKLRVGAVSFVDPSVSEVEEPLTKPSPDTEVTTEETTEPTAGEEVEA
jgi:hypothetical protein